MSVEFLHALVIDRLAVRQIGQTFAVHDRPAVRLLDLSYIVAAPGGDFGAQREQHGSFVSLAKADAELRRR